MEAFTYLTEHYLVSVMAALAFLVFIRCDCVDTHSTMNRFTCATISILVLIAAESAESYYASLTEPCAMRVVCSAVAYTARPAIAYFLCLVPALKNTPRLARYLYIPLAVDALVSFSALVSPLAFYYDSGNHFNRGPLGFISFVVGALYLLIMLWFCLQRMRRGETMDIVICGVGIVMCGIGVYLEYELESLGVLPAMALMGELFYYMYLLMTKYSSDYLTGAYVRSHMYKEIEARSCDRYYITFDVNGLKLINDKSGHAAGDKALVDFAGAVYKTLPTSALFYRLGGDEFAVIYRTAKEEDVLSLVRVLNEKCASLPYGISAGWAHFKASRDFDKASIEADSMLYADKEAFWEEYAKNHPEDTVRKGPRK